MYMDKVKEFAENNVAEAKNTLGIAYMTGEEVERDEERAVYWFHCTASQGNLETMANYGMSLLFGQGIKKDIGAALYVLESVYLLRNERIS